MKNGPLATSAEGRPDAAAKRSLAQTKHFQISKMLGEQIKYMAPGDLLPTVAEMMEEFDASQATITQALDRLRRRGVVERPLGRKRLVVAKLSERTLHQIAFVRPAYPSPDYDRLLYAIQEAALVRHWGVDIVSYSSLSNINFSRILDSNDAALFVPGSEPLPDHMKKAIASSERPIICLRELPPRGLRIRSILMDDYEVGRLATSHLQKLGHRRIVAMTSEPHSGLVSQRLLAWRDMMEKSGVRDVSSFLADCSVKAGTNSTQGSYQKFKQWLQNSAHPDFTAVFCCDWTGALAAMRALREHGFSIPTDVSLVTYSGEEDWSAFLNPPITTVEINLAEFATKSLEQVEEALEATFAGPVSPVRLKPYIVVRESTTKPTAVAKGKGDRHS